MSVTRVKSDDTDELVYHQGRIYGWPIGCGVVATGALLSNVWGMIQDWPTDAWQDISNIFFCALVVAWAIGKAARYQLVLDGKARQARVSIHRPWRTTKKVFEIPPNAAVLRCVSRPIETPDSHWVALRTPDGRELRLFEGPPYQELPADEADRIAAEVAAQLRLPVVSAVNGVDAARGNLSVPAVDAVTRSLDRGGG